MTESEKNKLRCRAYRAANLEKCREAVRRFRINNPEKYRVQTESARLKYKYGITLEEYDKLFEEQGGRCAICNLPDETFSKHLSVDHDHTTGKVRGLLCGNCNTGLGKFEESLSRLDAARAYLSRGN